jgi:hypothetical protein
MGIYRDLVYNNIAGFIAGAFPIIKTVLSEDHWHSMVRDFIAHHNSQSPYFLEISQEFLAYLTHERTATEQDPPFLVELAHYEWVELALDVADEELPQLHEEHDSLLDICLRLSPLAWCLAYQYPVHKIGESFQPDAPASVPTFLIVYRNHNDYVQFMEINAMTYGLLQLIQNDEHLSGREALLALAEKINPKNKESFFDAGENLLRQLFASGIILSLNKSV